MANNHKTARTHIAIRCLYGARDVHVGNLSSALRWKDADDDELGLQLIGCKSPPHLSLSPCLDFCLDAIVVN